MKIAISVIAFLVAGLYSVGAQAASCSSFVVIKSFDAAAKTLEVSHEKGRQASFFPKPEGAPGDTTKIPKKCASKMKKQTSIAVTPTGGRLTVTQVRSNYNGKMKNDTDDSGWFAAEMKRLAEAKTKVVAVVRPAKKRTDPPEMTTIYLPISDEERQEITRIEAQASDVD